MLVAVVLLQGCSAKKNTAGSRFWQAFTTRYNVYYHGKTNYDEQLKDMVNNYEDDYSQHLFIHPAEARAAEKAPQPSGSFDRTIEKMQKAISLHSIKKKPKRKSGKGNDEKYKEWLKRGEYNPFIHNAWFTLAKAEYMKGDFLNAAATFRYIQRHFTWKPELVQECQVWEALSYCAMGWTTEADNVLSHVHIDKIDDGRVRALANLAFADYYLKDKRTAQAIPYLSEAAQHADGWSQKVRLNFLLGQLYEENDQKELAYEAYKRAGSSNSATYRTKFNARIKQSAVYQGDNIEGEVKSLRGMARFDRNKEYLDQIYYAIGNLYLSRFDTIHAVENYKLAAEKSTRNGIDKAISQLTLGRIYFAQHKYDLAQPCYAEAVPQLSETYPNYKAIKKRSDVLDELAVYAQNVTLQDSLLRLSKMTPEEQKAVIKKIIDELKKKEKEEAENAKREEYLAQQNAKGNTLNQNGNTPTTFSINNDNSWYFYNTATKNAGKTAFQQQWGNRKLEDHWRRRNKNTFSLGDEEDQAETAPADSTGQGGGEGGPGGQLSKEEEEANKRANDPHYEEYYLKQIPTTEEQIQAAHDIIQEGLYNMGLILKDKLEDYSAAAHEFNELMTRYPNNTYRLEVYYNMYMMYMRNGDYSQAEHYRSLILSEFADSKYGQAMKDPNYLENLKNMQVYQEAMYEQAYQDYLNNNNEAVHAAYAEMMRLYPLSKIMPKFMFIDALSYVTQKRYDKFKEVIKDMLQRYPETDITPIASSIVKDLNAGRKLQGGSSNARGMLWSTRLSNDTTGADLEKKFTPFKEDFDKPHVFILLYPMDSVSSNLLLYEVARHNFGSFVVKDYDLEQMNFGRLGLLVVRGFADFNEVKHYRTVFEEDKSLAIPAQVHPVIISVDNFELLLNEGRSFEDYFNYLTGQEEKAIESQVPELSEEEAAAVEKEGEGEVTPPRQPVRPKNPEAKPGEEPSEPEASEQPGETKPDEMVKPDVPVEESDSAKAARAAIDKKNAEKAAKAAREKEAADKAEREKQAAARAALAAEQAAAEKAAAERAEAARKAEEKRKQEQLEAEQKQREAEARMSYKERKELRKEREKQQRELEEQRQDSIEQVQKEQQAAMQAAQKARADSLNLERKARQERAKAKEQQRVDEKKQREEERKLKAKEKEELRKAREKERKEKAKLREKERKEKAKLREQERKQREKERKEAAKQREKERKEKAKQREQERKDKAKQREQERKAAKKDKSSSSKSTKSSTTKSTKSTTTDDTSTADSESTTGTTDSVTTNTNTQSTRSVRDRKNN